MPHTEHDQATCRARRVCNQGVAPARLAQAKTCQLGQYAQCGQGLAHNGREHARNATIFGDGALSVVVLVVKADHRADGGAHFVIGGAHGTTALAQRIGGVIHVIGGAQVIAVGRDAFAQPAMGDGQAHSLGAQQDFAGAQSASAEHHAAGAQYKFIGAVEWTFGCIKRLLPSAALGGTHAMHQPITPGVGYIGAVRHIKHTHAGVHARTGLRRTRQVGFVQAELGVVVATRTAIAAAHTGVARAKSQRCVGTKLDGQRHVFGADLEARAGKPVGRGLPDVLHTLVLGSVLRHASGRRALHLGRLHLQHLRGHSKVGIQRAVTHCRGPGLLLKDPRIRAQGHRRVDEASAAQTIAHQGAGTGTHAKVKQRVFVTHRGRTLPAIRVASDLGANKAAELAKVCWKFTGEVLRAALQHRHTVAMLGKSQGRHRAAVTRPHHQDLRRIAFFPGTGDQLLHTV